MYKLLNDKFINSSLKVKIELYLLSLMVLFLIYYWIFYNKNEIVEHSKSENFGVVSIEKKFDGDFLTLFSDIENIGKENQIFIKSISKKANLVFISGISNKENFIKFLKDIEYINNFTKIDSFILSLDNNSFEYFFQIEIDLNNFFIKVKKKKEKKVQNNYSFKLNGIVDNYALINGNWLKVNEFIDNYKLIKIDKNYVFLKNDSQEIKLELNHE